MGLVTIEKVTREQEKDRGHLRELGELEVLLAVSQDEGQNYSININNYHRRPKKSVDTGCTLIYVS